MNHLLHWLTAHTEYNLHSPFVFNLYTSVINTRVKGHFGGHSYELIYKLINHFNAQHIWVDFQEEHLIQAITLANNQAILVETPQQADFVIAHTPKIIPTYQPSEHTIVLILHPHHTKNTEQEWQNLYTRLHARISIDLYHTGLLFMRHGLHPQHFRLR